jgi:hypothetical protein
MPYATGTAEFAPSLVSDTTQKSQLAKIVKRGIAI